MHGWLILDKPVGIGSTPCVSAVKRALRRCGVPKRKVGHGGTLDPLASGVLPIAVGEATKLAGRMLDADKAYEFTIRFGIETDTLDAEGVEVDASPHRPRSAEVAAVLARFTGVLDQVPPAYSALKVDGERAYRRARAGETVVLATRQVTVHALARQGGREDQAALEELTLRSRVSKGTYIRSLARDIARALGTVGHVTMLRRVRAGPFGLERAITLDKLAELATAHALSEAFLPLAAGLVDIPALTVTPDQARQLRQGRDVIGIAAPAGLSLALSDDVPIALVEASGPAVTVVRGFNMDDVAEVQS